MQFYDVATKILIGYVLLAMNTKKNIIILALFLLIGLPGMLWSQGSSAVLTWDELDNVKRYDVTIKDLDGSTVLKKSVYKGKIEISLPSGSYRINIDTIDYSGNVSSSSGWQLIEIETKGKDRASEIEEKRKQQAKERELEQERQDKERLEKKREEERKKLAEEKQKKKDKKSAKKKKQKKKYVTDLAGAGLKMSFGYFYSMPLFEWTDYYNDSYINALFRLTLIFGNLGSCKKYKFFKHFGLELDSSYMQFEGKDQTDIVPFNSKVIPVGLNIVFTSGSQVPFNIFIRMGGGVTFTRFEYFNRMPDDPENVWSMDYYFLGGLSFEIRYYKYLFIEFGADFLYINYVGEPYMGARYIFMTGIRF